LKVLLLRDAGALPFNKKERILYFLLLIFFFTMYIPGATWFYNIFVWPIFLYSFFFNSFSEKWRLLKQRREILVIILFFVLNCVSALLSENREEGISWMGLRLNLLVIPFAVGSLYVRQVLKDRIIFGFAFATSCAAAGCLMWGIRRSAQTHDWSLMYNDNLSGILLNITIFSFIYLLSKKTVSLNRSVLFPVLFLLFVVNFLLASRSAIIILYSAVFIFALFYIMRKRKILEGVTLIMGLLLGSFILLKFFPKTINRFKELGYTQFDYHSNGKESHYNMAITDQWNGANLRIAVWECAWTVIKKNMVLGTGLGDKMDELKKQYTEKGFVFGIQTNRNTHNNYLDVWLSLGLIGLILLTAGFFVLPVLHCIRDGDWWGIIVIICFVLALFTENYMDRTMGNTLLGLFMGFIASYKKPVGIKDDY
jgi:O-antigen ligase